MGDQIPAILAIETGVDNGRIIPLLQSPIIFGRDETSQIIVHDTKASRQHAQIVQVDGRFFIQDLKSTNGTWINEKPIKEQTLLNNKDIIRIGSTKFRFDTQHQDKDVISSILENQSLFAKTDPSTISQISIGAKLEQHRPYLTIPLDHLINHFCFILTGKLAVTLPAKELLGETKQYGEGEFLDGAYLAQLSPAPHITAHENSWLLLIERDKLNQLVVPFLNDLPFKDLPEDRLQAISRQMFIKKFKEGHILFKQGEYADALYIIIFGEVAMVKHSTQEGHTLEDEIFSYSRKSLFGELGMLIDKPRSTGGLVKEDSYLLVLPRSQFKALTDQYPDIALNLYRHIASLLDKQSGDFWQAAKEIDTMQELVQSTKMNALGQLVAGIAHEINTPVGSISSNSYQMRDLLTKTQTYIDNMPQIITQLSGSGNALQSAAGELNYALDAQTRELVKKYTANLSAECADNMQKLEMDFLMEDMLEISDELSEASKRIKVIVKNLANFARLDEAERKTVDIHEGLDATLSLLHHELKYQVNVKTEYSVLPKITCHPNELNQVFMNILMNAIQALELNRLRQENKRGNIQIKTYREDQWAVIAITDDGRGISPQNMTRIFEPFFSTKGAAAAAGGLGLGLGLAISKKIVEEKHRGRLEVESTLGEGATFYIWLPLDKAPPAVTTQTMTIIGEFKDIKSD
jgi:signal transduction histidine kinase/pSer/pThr/pTyr-binding forkhead associated (FHA) protein